LEYFRSELYYLRFSWLNIGYAFQNYPAAPLDVFGMYGVGFLIISIAAIFSFRDSVKKSWIHLFPIILPLLIPLSWFLMLMSAARHERPFPPVKIVGVQMEFPPENIIPKMLNKALAKSTNASIFVLSEYTLEGSVPDSLKKWCRDNSRFLVVGGKLLLPMIFIIIRLLLLEQTAKLFSNRPRVFRFNFSKTVWLHRDRKSGIRLGEKLASASATI
jgi:hypothetical protein